MPAYRRESDPLGRGEAACLWALDPDITFLNHGSFGACPRVVMQEQQRIREIMEAEPVRFLDRGFDARLGEARRELAAFTATPEAGFSFVPNATAGVNAVLRSFPLRPGDELLTTDHEYAACRKTLEYAARQAGATVRVVPVPFPAYVPESLPDLIEAALSPRTALALIDHITSATALVFPVAEVIARCRRRGVPVMVDGAHAPGHIPLNVASLDPDFYTGNFHKWLCAPKGSAFLYVAHAWRERLQPLAISHGYDAPDDPRGSYHARFDWTGTADPSAWFATPCALRFLDGVTPGGIEALQQRNHLLTLAARDLLCDALNVQTPAPDECLPCMAAVPLPGVEERFPRTPADRFDPLTVRLFEEFRIEVPVTPLPDGSGRAIRVSAQAYNTLEQYELLAAALARLLRA